MIQAGICPITKLTAVTATSIMFIGSRSWVSATTRTDGRFSPVILFRPYRARREAALAMDNPAEGVAPHVCREIGHRAGVRRAARPASPRVAVQITVAHNKIPL